MFFWHSHKNMTMKRKTKKYSEQRSRTQFMKTLDWDSN